MVSPNRQRDETPEAKPQWQQCLCAEGAKHHRSKEGQVLSDLFDEFVLVTANLWGGAKQKQA
jgi:hypothetical protein